MDLEPEAINKNDTQELTKLPQGGKKVGVKWIYKTKFNENREVDKCKARLVAEGYTYCLNTFFLKKSDQFLV